VKEGLFLAAAPLPSEVLRSRSSGLCSCTLMEQSLPHPLPPDPTHSCGAVPSIPTTLSATLLPRPCEIVSRPTSSLPHGPHPHPCRRYSGRLTRLPGRMAPFGMRRGPRLPFAGRRNRGGQPQAATSTKAAPTRSASLPDLPDDLLQLVFNRLCAFDRMAPADVSKSWRTACAVDLYATAATAVLSSAATPTDCNEFGRATLGPPGGVRRVALLLGKPLVPQAAMASQGRLLLLCLRVATSLSKSYKALDLAAPAPYNAVGWADTLSPFSPQQLGRTLVCVRMRNEDGATAWEARHVWGIRLDTGWVDGADVHGVHVSGDDTPDVLFNIRAALRVAFLSVGDVFSSAGVAQCASMRSVLAGLRRRAWRGLIVRRLLHSYTGSDNVGTPAGPSGRRPYLIEWMSTAMGVENSPIMQFLDSAPKVDEAHVAALVCFVVAVYDQAAIFWPKMVERRACMHWSPVERHVIRFAVYVFAVGDTRDVLVAEVAAHMPCLGVARVCTSLGRRRGPMPLRGRCGAPFLS